MTSFLLAIDEQDARSAQGFDEVFLWDGGPQSTFTGTLGPHLNAFGPVAATNVDFVRIALGVFAADRSVRRRGGGADWNARDLAVTVQVADPAVWQPERERLSLLVGFLTGDRWTFDFVAAPESAVSALQVEDAGYSSTVLLSGGADSAVGALHSALQLADGASQALVSHFSLTAISPFQKGLVTAIDKLAPDQTSIHFQVHLSRGSKRLDGTKFKEESSSRSRSLLFLALGLAVAERAKTPLVIPENGFASLNPPLGPERRGALSTHTTHPRFLGDLQTLLQSIGAYGAIENPFQQMTKGEMFVLIAKQVGADQASKYLSATNSCSHSDARYSKAPPGSSCGVCFGCVVRRAAFHASGVVDATIYLSEDQTGRFDSFVKQKSILVPMRDFSMEPFKPRAIMAMSLPDDYAASDALDLCRRGVEELRAFLR